MKVKSSIYYTLAKTDKNGSREIPWIHNFTAFLGLHT